jgi:hypothetical protein
LLWFAQKIYCNTDRLKQKQVCSARKKTSEATNLEPVSQFYAETIEGRDEGDLDKTYTSSRRYNRYWLELFP